MKLAPLDIDFLELLIMVTAQGALLFAAWGILGRGSEAIAAVLLAGTIILGLLTLYWDRLLWLHPWDRPKASLLQPGTH